MSTPCWDRKWTTTRFFQSVFSLPRADRRGVSCLFLLACSDQFVLTCLFVAFTFLKLVVFNFSTLCSIFLRFFTSCVEEHALKNSMSRPRHDNFTNPKHNRTNRVGALISSHLETRSHPWVPAGHPQYTGALHGGPAVDGPISTPAQNTL